MKKSLVVLVPLYIGLVSGFIVSSEFPKELEKSKEILNDTHIKEINMEFTTDTRKSNSIDSKYTKDTHYAWNNKEKLNNSRRNINETELFEDATAKTNNVNERSFIYINKKYRTSLLSPLVQHKNPLLSSPANHINLINFNEFPKKIFTAYVDPPITGYILRNKDMPYSLVKKENYTAPQSGTNKVINASQNNTADVDDRLKYLELMKPPILRAAPYNKKPKGELNVQSTTILSKALPPNKYLLSKNNLPSKYPGILQFAPSKVANFGYPSPYTFRPHIFPKKGQMYTHMKPIKNMHQSNFIDDVFAPTAVAKFFDKLTDDYAAMDSYVKTFIEEQFVDY